MTGCTPETTARFIIDIHPKLRRGINHSHTISMAKRIKTYQTERTREKIKATQLVNRLQKIGMGDLNVTAAQVNAINILLRKVLPDLSESNITHHEEEKSYAENRSEMVVMYGEAKTKLLMMEPLEWEDVRELEGFLEKEKARLTVSHKPKLAAENKAKDEVETKEVKAG